ncbi:MAG TPA: GDP-mannose pyrophosphatase NudK [Chitinophagaceae bacterium]|jgi:nudix-type nucleoside diphosphatase (YffH/AdpP family)|nr:GDP-mannose pyrophosphatase NudK [Chitinophagaceae bacterium]
MDDRINIKDIKILSDDHYILKKVTFDYKKKNGESEQKNLEVYDRGNAATVLLYNVQNRTVILLKQFRLPAFMNGSASGMLLETCAGLLEDDSPEECVKRETEEETGYKISKVQKVFDVYMSPGSVTELLHFFVAEYSNDMKVNEGGGLEGEEDIEVLEIPFDQALSMIESGEIQDAKTILLLQYAQLRKLL